MRTAEEIIYEHFFPDQVEDLEVFKQMINEARKEAIEECCRVALDYVSESEELLILDQKILSLINDLK